MSNEDDWDFVGEGDAKLMILAAVCLKTRLLAIAVTLWLRSSRWCAKPRRIYHSINPVRLMMRRLAWRRYDLSGRSFGGRPLDSPAPPRGGLAGALC